jgi:hypothetical protein
VVTGTMTRVVTHVVSYLYLVLYSCPLGFLLPKTIKIFGFHLFCFDLTVPYESYSTNASFALNLIYLRFY